MQVRIRSDFLYLSIIKYGQKLYKITNSGKPAAPPFAAYFLNRLIDLAQTCNITTIGTMEEEVISCPNRTTPEEVMGCQNLYAYKQGDLVQTLYKVPCKLKMHQMYNDYERSNPRIY